MAEGMGGDGSLLQQGSVNNIPENVWSKCHILGSFYDLSLHLSRKTRLMLQPVKDYQG